MPWGQLFKRELCKGKGKALTHKSCFEMIYDNPEANPTTAAFKSTYNALLVNSYNAGVVTRDRKIGPRI
jgi:hypothetical protein